MPTESMPIRRPFFDLFLISFVILFFELACIRWFGSTVTFLTFFTNIVLMACFLGMTLGCLAASRPRDYIKVVIPVAVVSALLAYGVYLLTHHGQLFVNIGNQRSPQQIYFGSDVPANDLSKFVVPIEVVCGLFYVLIAMMFVGLGQVLGRAFNAIPNRVGAYTTNVLGSLAGIVAFGLVSYLRTTPLVWFAISLAICLYFLRPWSFIQIGGVVALLVLIAQTAYSGNMTYMVLWSPYYKIQYSPVHQFISTNNIGHQKMSDVEHEGVAYALPHLLNRDAGGKPFENVLIIGAGSGNDVQRALMHGAKHIDAVEIDPVINEIGRKDHPNHPFDDPRVTVHLDDGRRFLKKTGRKYDLVIYALVDSLILHSGYSSLRLESFLFTEEAFGDIKAVLKPDGAFVMYNFFRQGWVVGRIEKMAEKVFGKKPLVIPLPYRPEIKINEQQVGITLVMVDNTESHTVEAIGQKLKEKEGFWVNEKMRFFDRVNGYGPQPPPVSGARPSDWIRIGAATLDNAGITLLPSDNWPFLYLREAAIPTLNLRGMAMVAVLSLALLFMLAPVRTLRPNGRMFFLGAGFMLLETKGVVHMALLFGSTWVVNSIVFFAILVMILLSNLFVLAFQPRRLWPFYVLLLAALLVNAYVPMRSFLTLPDAYRVAVSCAVVFVPIFFAGVIFAASFRDSLHPDIDFGSNIGGVILGGLSENFSLMLGFDHLLLVAIAFYVLSALLKPRLPAVSVPVPSAP